MNCRTFKYRCYSYLLHLYCKVLHFFGKKSHFNPNMSLGFYFLSYVLGGVLLFP